MKRILLVSIVVMMFHTCSFATEEKVALLIIDIQNFYFHGGESELVEPVKAAENAAKLLVHFRKKGMEVIHIRHNSEPGGEINELVMALSGEKVISKDEINCFVGTDLLDYLRSKNINTVVICGMQTHMCVEAATRAAADLGFKCILVKDACATKNLKFEDKIIKAEDVQYSTLATLRNYATIVSTNDCIEKEYK